MGVGWGVLVPLAILLAAAFKHIGHLWYLLHTGLQLCALGVVCAGFALAVEYVHKDFKQTDTQARAHAWLGLLAVIAMFANPALGFYANAVYNPDRTAPPVWPDLVHAWIGRVGLALASAAIITGIVVLDVNRGYIAVYVVWIALLVVVGLVVRHRQGRKHVAPI